MVEFARITSRAAPRTLADALRRLGLSPVYVAERAVYCPADDRLWDALSRLNPAASPSADWPEPLPVDAEPLS